MAGSSSIFNFFAAEQKSISGEPSSKFRFFGEEILRNSVFLIQRGFRHFELTRAGLDPKGMNDFMPAFRSTKGGLS